MTSTDSAAPIFVIACGVFAADLPRVAEKSGFSVAAHFLPGGLHEHPGRLRAELQAAVDSASQAGQWERIVIGYGICGRGTVGIQARSVPLILPRVHDCIALFLGGNLSYEEQFRHFPGTYYISQGWYAEKGEQAAADRPHAWMGNTKVYFDQLVRKYGRERARETFAFLNTWRSNYQRAVFIDTEAAGGAGAEQYAQQMAARHGWKYERIAGSDRLLRQLLTATETSDEILVVPPKYVTVFDATGNGLAARPFCADVSACGRPQKTVEVCRTAVSAENGDLKVGLGIDAGGTYTDAVLYDFAAGKVRCKHKALTTKWDFAQGIRRALLGLDPDLLSTTQIVAVSTTLATNALVEGEGQKVGLLFMPPPGMTVGDIAHKPQSVISGRLDITGQVIEPPDETQVRRTAREMVDGSRVAAFAVSGYAGSINPEHEVRVKQILQAETGLFVCCGHELSQLLNFKVRAETAVHNARIVPGLVRLLRDIEKILTAFRITAPIMVVRGDGALMTRAMAAERPVETILSGPAASVAGARFLTGINDAVVVDMGGTTTDIASVDDGAVRICANGSKVGDARTHVKALDIHTTGLGGDSLVEYQQGSFTIGPRRVAPIAWLGDRFADGDPALTYLQGRKHQLQRSSRAMQILALNDGAAAGDYTDAERRVLDLLDRRPYSVAELVERTGAFHPAGLPLVRLEENFVIQRCGLTPTDLLHAAGRFDRWNTGASRRMCALVADLAGMAVQELVAHVMQLVIRRLALAIIHSQMAAPEHSPESATCPMCRQMLENLLAGGSEKFTLRFQLHHPIIGVGAPVGHFLPQTARLLGAQAVLPPDMDVANAIGAITSQVVIERRVAIKPYPAGGFYVEGIAGHRRFGELAAAESFAKQQLVDNVRILALAAGTSQTAVQVVSEDRTALTSQGDEIFLEREISSRICGSPDLVVRHRGSIRTADGEQP
jgi:N-methylhydantoinase A/oxoprolinase/acetone carboxylase beta subunit